MGAVEQGPGTQGCGLGWSQRLRVRSVTRTAGENVWMMGREPQAPDIRRLDRGSWARTGKVEGGGSGELEPVSGGGVGACWVGVGGAEASPCLGADTQTPPTPTWALVSPRSSSLHVSLPLWNAWALPPHGPHSCPGTLPPLPGRPPGHRLPHPGEGSGDHTVPSTLHPLKDPGAQCLHPWVVISPGRPAPWAMVPESCLLGAWHTVGPPSMPCL